MHYPGLNNQIPDALFQLFETEKNEIEDRVGLVLATVGDGEIRLENPPVYLGVLPGVYSKDLEQLELVEDPNLRKDLMTRAHVGFHEGAAGMARMIRASLKSTWPSMERDCQNFVRTCIKCQKNNVGRNGCQPLPSMVGLDPDDHISIDLKELPLSESGITFDLLVINVATCCGVSKNIC